MLEKLSKVRKSYKKLQDGICAVCLDTLRNVFLKKIVAKMLSRKGMVPKNKFFKRLKCEKKVLVCEEFDL